MAFRTIIVGYDGSDHAGDGLALGVLIARISGAKLLLVHVFRHDLPLAPGWEKHEEALRANAETLLSDAASTLEDVAVETRAIGSSSAAWGLHDLAEAERADLVALGSTHRGPLGRVFMGTVAERLFHGASCPVAVAPRGFQARPPAGLRVVGVAFDGSPESKAALSFAKELAETAGARVRVLAVLDPRAFSGYAELPQAFDREELLRREREQLERELAAALDGLPARVNAESELLSGDPADTLASNAEEGIDLLVVGSRGYGPARHVLLGSVSSKLARSAPCALAVVPRTAQHSRRPDRAAVAREGS